MFFVSKYTHLYCIFLNMHELKVIGVEINNIVTCCFSLLCLVERNTGIEPASQAWEARALPMC